MSVILALLSAFLRHGGGMAGEPELALRRCCQITQTLPVFVHTLNIRLPHWDDSYTMQEV
jgi:hypothetical protein